jgi:hypothetical protein
LTLDSKTPLSEQMAVGASNVALAFTANGSYLSHQFFKLFSFLNHGLKSFNHIGFD